MGKKVIVYHAHCNSIDGRGPRSLAFSSLVESERDRYIQSSDNKAWLVAGESVEDLDAVAHAALQTLSPLQKLAINVVSKPQNPLSSRESKSPLDDPAVVDIRIRFGKSDGRHFTQWRFDDLQRLFDAVVAVGDSRAIAGITDARIWYDEASDYHRLSIDFWGRTIDVRYYKVLHISLGSEPLICPIPISSMQQAVYSIAAAITFAYGSHLYTESPGNV